MDGKASLALKLLFSLLLFAAIFYFVGFEKILTQLLLTDPWYLLAAVLLYGVVLAAMCLRIELVLDSMGEKVPLKDIFPSNLEGMLASDFTPARVGYFFTAFSLSSRFKIELEKTFLSIFGPQLLDFVIKLTAVSVLTMLIVGRLGAEGIIFNILFVLVTLCAIILSGLLVFHPPFMERMRFLERLPFASRGFAFLSRMHNHSDRLLSIKGKILAVTLLTWLLRSFHWMLLSRAVGFSISESLIMDFGFIMLFQASVTLVQFLPLPTIAGAGTSEAAFAAILYVFGLPIEVGVTFALVTRVVMLVHMLALPSLYDFIHENGLEGFQQAIRLR